MHISVIIPAYNEARTIRTVLERVLKACDPVHKWTIIVVDDCSGDATAEIVGKFAPKVRLIIHKINQGKGAALKTGFAAAEGDVVLIQDADLEYNPAEYPDILKPITDGEADVVWGSRFVGSHPHRVLYFWHFVANRALTVFSNMTTNLNLSDMECGLVGIRMNYLKKMPLEENGFGNQPEMVARLAQLQARFFEVGISYYGRTYAEGKKITWVHGFEALWCIVKYGLLQRLPKTENVGH